MTFEIFTACVAVAACIAIICLTVKLNRLEARNWKLEKENRQLRTMCRDLTDERDTVIRRDDAKRSHFVLLRDQELDQAREACKVKDAQNRLLSQVIHTMWPKYADVREKI